MQRRDIESAFATQKARVRNELGLYFFGTEADHLRKTRQENAWDRSPIANAQTRASP